jgi:hypothetical protein
MPHDMCDGKQPSCNCQLSVSRGCAQVRQAQQMSGLVSRKKAELTAKLQRLQERRDALAAQLDSSSADAAGMCHAVIGVLLTLFAVMLFALMHVCCPHSRPHCWALG